MRAGGEVVAGRAQRDAVQRVMTPFPIGKKKSLCVGAAIELQGTTWAQPSNCPHSVTLPLPHLWLVESASSSLLSRGNPVAVMLEAPSTLAVHRCRFVDFAPSAVTALAFPPLPLPSVKGKRVAKRQGFPGFGPLVVGRANGNIELCEWTGSSPRTQAPQAWVVRKVCFLPPLWVYQGLRGNHFGRLLLDRTLQRWSHWHSLCAPHGELPGRRYLRGQTSGCSARVEAAN